ncbi:hypothetical protein NCU04550 [Neurospora crassa OR74A]|uniref:Uncharacterized protein n=1 Tax=Neurospora crassa (strain ATCC 24698 / 74-OR23-1A / CBS 708.71 / DSM 1257 / FGSC 987) TaxID=367110 RepID=Q7RWE1_NEUCR|nr:hypothetical protein NCU04550 [Neurospora crassa OR74A]EAA26705.1 hypothetical protein NCU04550 [Neurospora crassa OR74A]|eukprot:XP_955941.1 hypothetical protein NCU04550 [Neurospora crassa OR74A]
MEAPSSFSTPKRKRPLPFEPTIPNLNQTRALTGLTGEFTFELGLPTDTEDGSKSPRTTVAHRLQQLFLNGGALGGTSTGGVFGGGIAPARTSTLQPQQPLSQTQQQYFGYPFPRISRSQDMQEVEEDRERPGGPRKRAKLHDRDIDMTGIAETPMRPPASTNNGGTFEAAGTDSTSSMPTPSTPVSQQAGAVITPSGPFPKRRLAPKGVRFNMDPAENQQAELGDNTMGTSGTIITQTTKNNDIPIPSSSPLSSITKVVAIPSSTPTQRPLAPKPANISMAPPSSSSAAAATKKPRKSKSPPLQPQPATSTSTSSPHSPTVIDPIRASLTWQDSEITVYDPDDSDDDGTGINGIGFRPTPEMEHARRMKRKKQLAEYRKREMGEARARRKERRAGADGLVGSGNEGGGGSNGGPKSKDAMATAKGKLKAEKRMVRFLETVTKTVVEMPPPTPVTMMEGVMQSEAAAAAEGQGPSEGDASGSGNTSVSGMAGAGADIARVEA